MRRIDEYRVRHPPQRAHLTSRINPVALGEVGQHRLPPGPHALPGQLQLTAPRPLGRVALDEYLQVGVREDHAADVPPLADDCLTRSNAPLLYNQSATHRGNRRHLGNQRAHLRRPNLLAYVFAVKERPHPTPVPRDRDTGPLQQRKQGSRVCYDRACPQRLQRQGPVHRAGVEVPEPEPLRAQPRGRTLARPGRAVNREGESARALHRWHYIKEPGSFKPTRLSRRSLWSRIGPAPEPRLRLSKYPSLFAENGDCTALSPTQAPEGLSPLSARPW